MQDIQRISYVNDTKLVGRIEHWLDFKLELISVKPRQINPLPYIRESSDISRYFFEIAGVLDEFPMATSYFDVKEALDLVRQLVERSNSIAIRVNKRISVLDRCNTMIDAIQL